MSKHQIYTTSSVTLHVSVWVEMKIKYFLSEPAKRHAPRERVSWNYSYLIKYLNISVTLHVSVWVEIKYKHTVYCVLQSRSTWACELKYGILGDYFNPVSSRSTWACELKCNAYGTNVKKIMSRSTWACELKLRRSIIMANTRTSRSTWACELKWQIRYLRL